MAPRPRPNPSDAPAAHPGAHACVLPHELMGAVALLQEKWTLSILYVLMQGPNGFNGVGREAGAVNASTLAQRLTTLEEAGLVEKTVQSTMPPRTSYALTPVGEALRPVLSALERWADRYGVRPVRSAGPARPVKTNATPASFRRGKR